MGIKSTLHSQASEWKNRIWLHENIANPNKPFAVWLCVPAAPVQMHISVLMQTKRAEFELPLVFAFHLIFHQLLNVTIKKKKKGMGNKAKEGSSPHKKS